MKGRSFLVRMFTKLLSSAVIVFVFCFILLFAYQFIREKTLQPAKKADTIPIVVLGAQVKPDGTPSVQLALRLDTAWEAYKQMPRTIVVTGAQGKDEPKTEASVMRDYLIQKGVAKEHILMDDKSFNTRENILNALNLLPKGTKKISLVTSDYHLPRAIAVAKDLHIDADGFPSPTKPEFWLKNHARETLAWGKYFLNKILNNNNP